jgi:hypothetical protein
MRRIVQPAMGERVCDEHIAKFIGDTGLRYETMGQGLQRTLLDFLLK